MFLRFDGTFPHYFSPSKETKFKLAAAGFMPSGHSRAKQSTAFSGFKTAYMGGLPAEDVAACQMISQTLIYLNESKTAGF